MEWKPRNCQSNCARDSACTKRGKGEGKSWNGRRMEKVDRREHGTEGRSKEKQKTYNEGGFCSAGLNIEISNYLSQELKLV
jgi:hypothetical protein